jgi:hypothetical protein
MRYRASFAALLAMLLFSGLAKDAAAASASQPATATAAAAAQPAAAAADKVYPPLPSLAMLPPGSDDDDEPLPKSGAKGKKRGRVFVRARPVVVPPVKMIVTDASRTYLQGVEDQLDAALAK